MSVDPTALTSAVNALSAKTATEDPLANLQAGTTIQAKVAAMISETLARLVLPGGAHIEAQTPQALPTGATLRFSVQREGDQVQLHIDASSLPQPTSRSSPNTIAATALATRSPAANVPLTTAQTGRIVLNLLPQLIATTPAAMGSIAAAVSELPQVDAVSAKLTAPELAPAKAAFVPAPLANSDPIRDILTKAIRAAAPLQDSFAPLFANLAAAAELPALPKPVLNAALQLLGLQLDASKPTTAEDLQKLVNGSGIFLESHLAAGDANATPKTDIKAALLALKSALTSIPVADNAKAQIASNHDRPPLRTLAPQAQPSAVPSITDKTPRDDIIRALSTQTDASLSRLTLLQAASLPDPRDAIAANTPHQQVAVFDMPVRMGQHTTIAQFRVSQEADEEESKNNPAATRHFWNLRFSLDAEPMGPVHAQVRFRDSHVSVHLWAEEAKTAQDINGHLPDLQNALEGSAFTVDGLHCQTGRPSDPETPAPRPPGRLLDRRT